MSEILVPDGNKLSESKKKYDPDQLEIIVKSLLDPHVLMKRVFDGSGAVIDFIYTSANPAACAYLKVQEQNLIGSRLLDILPGRNGRETLSLYAQVMQTNQEVALDDVPYPSEGENRYCDVRAIKVGSTLSCTWRDVTERHIAVFNLKASEKKYQVLAESATDVVYQLDKDGVLLWISPAVESVLKWRPDQLLGKHTFKLTHPDDIKKLKEWRDEILEGAKTKALVRPFELRCRLPDGSYRWVSIQSRPLFNAVGEFDGTIVGLRDVHEQVMAQKILEKKKVELEKSEERFRLLAENATDVVMLINQEWKLTWVSPATERVLGYKVSDLLGTNTAKLVHPDDILALSVLRESSSQLEKGVRPACN